MSESKVLSSPGAPTAFTALGRSLPLDFWDPAPPGLFLAGPPFWILWLYLLFCPNNKHRNSSSLGLGPCSLVTLCSLSLSNVTCAMGPYTTRMLTSPKGLKSEPTSPCALWCLCCLTGSLAWTGLTLPLTADPPPPFPVAPVSEIGICSHPGISSQKAGS